MFVGAFGVYALGSRSIGNALRLRRVLSLVLVKCLFSTRYLSGKFLNTGCAVVSSPLHTLFVIACKIIHLVSYVTYFKTINCSLQNNEASSDLHARANDMERTDPFFLKQGLLMDPLTVFLGIHNHGLIDINTHRIRSSHSSGPKLNFMRKFRPRAG